MKAFVVTLAVLLVAGEAAAENFSSAYTTQDYQKCAVVSREDGSIKRRCAGYGGITINWFGADDDAIVDFGRRGDIGDASGLSFAVAKDTIEWRGPKPGKAIVPLAAIVRYSICRSVEGPCRDTLYVYRLNGQENSCVMAIVDGRAADANVKARRMADEFGASFRCGKDKAQGD